MDIKTVRNRVDYNDLIVVKYSEIQYKSNSIDREKVTLVDEGVVKSIPSKKFTSDAFVLDYELSAGSAIRSVNIEDGKLAQLLYEAGGDRDWDQWELESVEVNENRIYP